jgi:pyrroline-5-carboxylate reductase
MPPGESSPSGSQACGVRLVGVIGTGVMGGALLKGMVQAGVVAGHEVLAYDPQAERLGEVCAATGAAPAPDNGQVVEQCDFVLLAVKPQVLGEVLAPLRERWRAGQLLISIVAGVSIARLKELTRSDLAVARVMPNVLCVVRAGAAGMAFSPEVSEVQRAFVRRMLEAVGLAVEVEERLLDALTGLAGSGPAFVAVVVEALADGGVAAGLPRSQALQLAAQTVMGTGKYLLQTGQHPALLKDQVCSPGGTTIAGLRVLEGKGLRAALLEAVQQAAARSRELGQS